MILVTGSTGPLGFAFRDLPESHNFILSNSSICNLANRLETEKYLTDLVNQYDIEGIIHLAAKSGGVVLNKTSPADLITENLEMAMNILRAAQNVRVKRVVLALSTACYSSKISNPKESQILEFEIQSNDYAYAYAKRMFVPLMHAFNSQFAMQVTCAVINGVVGPNMNFKEGESTLVPALIKRFYSERKSSEAITVWGDGSPIREYTYSKDLSRILIWTMQNQESSTVLNIGNTEKISVRDVAETICEEFGININRLVFDESKPNGRMVQSTDNSVFLEKYPYRYLSPREAIKIACRWFDASMKSGAEFKI